MPAVNRFRAASTFLGHKLVGVQSGIGFSVAKKLNALYSYRYATQ